MNSYYLDLWEETQDVNSSSQREAYLSSLCAKENSYVFQLLGKDLCKNWEMAMLVPIFVHHGWQAWKGGQEDSGAVKEDDQNAPPLHI